MSECTQCKGVGSWPLPTRQVCPRCQGSRVEPGEKDGEPSIVEALEVDCPHSPECAAIVREIKAERRSGLPAIRPELAGKILARIKEEAQKEKERCVYNQTEVAKALHQEEVKLTEKDIGPEEWDELTEVEKDRYLDDAARLIDSATVLRDLMPGGYGEPGIVEQEYDDIPTPHEDIQALEDVRDSAFARLRRMVGENERLKQAIAGLEPWMVEWLKDIWFEDDLREHLGDKDADEWPLDHRHRSRTGNQLNKWRQ